MATLYHDEEIPRLVNINVKHFINLWSLALTQVASNWDSTSSLFSQLMNAQLGDSVDWRVAPY